MTDELAVVSLMADLERSGAITPVSLTIPAGLTYERAEAIGTWTAVTNRASRFWLGDWINYMEAEHGEKYAQAVEVTGMDPEWLQHVAYVCRRVAPAQRRLGLPFALHRVVAPLDPDEQERWLEQAEQNGWTRKQLRERLPKDESQQKTAATGDDPESERPPSKLVDVCRELLRTAVSSPGDPDHMLVPVDVVTRMMQALNQEA